MLPSFLLQNDNRTADGQGPVEGPNTENKAAVWPTFGAEGAQASSLAEGRSKTQGHPVTVPGQAWAGPRCPIAPGTGRQGWDSGPWHYGTSGR